MNFWEDVVQQSLEARPIADAWADLKNVASLRPTVYIGLGGIGSMVVRKVKRAIQELIPDANVRRGFAYLALDTHARERTDILDQNEYLELSVGVDPAVIVNQPQYRATLGWYRDLTGQWNAPAIRGGAHKIRVLGRFAFCYGPTLQAFCDRFNSIINQIRAFREAFGEVEIKVYIISSLAGGTGSGVLLDVIAVTQALLQGIPAKRQAILILPDVLEGEAPPIDIPDLYANTYATLRELYRVLCQRVSVSYGLSGLDRVEIRLPNPIYVLASRNEDGIGIVERSDELADIVANYLLTEIQTPLETREGKPKVQDAENADLQTHGNSGMYKCFSSFGTVRFGFPVDIVRDIFTLAILDRALQEEIQEGIISSEEANAWVHQQELSEAASDQLQERIRRDPQGQSLRVSINMQERVEDVSRDNLADACDRLVKELSRALEDQYKSIIQRNAEALSSEALEALNRKLNEALQRSVGYALAWARTIQVQLEGERQALAQEYQRTRDLCEQFRQQRQGEAIRQVRQAAQSGVIGRRGRIQAAVSALEAEFNQYLNQSIILWSQEEGLRVYTALLEVCSRFIESYDRILQRLQALRHEIRKTSQGWVQELDRMANVDRRGRGNRFSLVDGNQIHLLYQRWFPEASEVDLAQTARSRWREQGLLEQALTLGSQEWISQASETIRQEVDKTVKQFNIVYIINQFYPNPEEQSRLFRNIHNLCKPLFPLNINFKEPGYWTAWVVASHPSIRDQWRALIESHIPPGAGMNDAYFPNPYEVLVYTITHGYTPHSLQLMTRLKAPYDSLQGRYEKARAQRRPHRPIHAWVWPDTESPPDLIPRPPVEEEAFEWFIVGRAFSQLFPSSPEPSKNRAFIYTRGPRYYILDDSGKEHLVGNGLSEAIERFEDSPEWRDLIRRRIEAQVRQVGVDQIRQRLEREYMPVLEEEIERARQNNEHERETILVDLKGALQRYIERELRIERV